MSSKNSTPAKSVLDDEYPEDEGWIWLPWEELQEIQRLRNQALNEMFDALVMTTRRGG